MHNYSTYSDEQLLALLKNDNVDQQAFGALFNKYWKLLFNNAYKSLKHIDQCKELVNDIFLELWERRNSLAINNLEAYLKTAVRFRVINYISRVPRHSFYELFDTMTSSPHLPDTRLLEKDLVGLIEKWMEVLPEKRRDIFIKHFFQHLSTKEIASELNISQKTVQNQLGTAVHSLYARFGHLLSVLPASVSSCIYYL